MDTAATGTRTAAHVIELKDPRFISSTFGFFALALLLTGVGTSLGFVLMNSNPEVFANPAIFYGAIILELILAFTSRAWSRRLPFGYAMFSFFALLSGFTLVPILMMAGAMGGIVMIAKALFASVSVFMAAALYGWTTNRNLLGMGGFLMMTLIGVIIMGVLGIFFPWNNITELVVSGFIIVLFAGFTMYDIQMIQRGPLTNPLLAAIALYLSFINIFVAVLRFMIAMGRD